MSQIELKEWRVQSEKLLKDNMKLDGNVNRVWPILIENLKSTITVIYFYRLIIIFKNQLII